MKKIIELVARVTKFITLSNLFISLCAFFFTLQSALLFPIDFRTILNFSILNSVAVFFLYNLQRYYYATINSHTPSEKDVWYNKHKYLLLAILVLAMIISFTQFFEIIFILLKKWWVLLPALFFSFFYFLPPLKLREKYFIKPFVIAFCWVYVCCYLPIFCTINDFESIDKLTYLLYFVSQFFYFVSICIPFDIRDLEIDKARGIKSIPVMFSVNAAKLIAIIMSVLFLLMGLMIFGKEVGSLGFLLMATINTVFIVYSSTTKNALYYSLLGDGLIILQFIIFYALFQ